MFSPKAYLVTATCRLDEGFDHEDQKHVQRINDSSYFIDAVEGFYLTNRTPEQFENYCVVPLYEDVRGSFDLDTQHWLEARNVTIHHVEP